MTTEQEITMPHTPGPWTCDVDEAIGGSIQVYPEGHFLEPWIADVKGEHVGPQSREEIKANARLIIAAPDLLAILKAAAEDDTVQWHDGSLLKAAREAIAKAEGRR